MKYICYYIVFINININIYKIVAIVVNSTIVGDVLDRFKLIFH